MPFSAHAGTGSYYYFSKNFYFLGNSQSTSDIYGSIVLSSLGSELVQYEPGGVSYYQERILGILTIHNQSSQGWLSDNTLFRFNFNTSRYPNHQLCDVEYLGGYLKPTGVTTGGNIAFTPVSSDNAQSRTFAISPKSSVSCVFYLVFDYFSSTSTQQISFNDSEVTLNYPSPVTGTFGNYYTTNVDLLPSIYNEAVASREYLELILQSLSSTNSSSSDLVTDSGTTSDDIASIHSQEQSYFSQNQQALEATGIGNFEFSSDITGGLSVVRNDFLLLWYALGDFRWIFLFTLLIALATFIIRHNPSLRANRALAMGTSIRHNASNRRFRS